MYMFTIAELEEMIALGRRAGLVKMHLVAGNMPRARRVCNGIGAEWFPGWLRWLVGAVCPHLVVISLPHDIEYSNGGGVRGRWKSDWHFLTNGLRIAWYCKSRKTAYQAVVLWLFLRLFGAAAFNWKEAK